MVLLVMIKLHTHTHIKQPGLLLLLVQDPRDLPKKMVQGFYRLDAIPVTQPTVLEN